jgi:hypothetical protein
MSSALSANSPRKSTAARLCFEFRHLYKRLGRSSASSTKWVHLLIETKFVVLTRQTHMTSCCCISFSSALRSGSLTAYESVVK